MLDFSPFPFHPKCYLLSVQLLNLLFLCPNDFIQLTHPAEFGLAREINRRDPSSRVRTIIKWSRTAGYLRQRPFLLADMCRRIPCSHLDPTARGKMGSFKGYFTGYAPTLESGELMQWHGRQIVLLWTFESQGILTKMEKQPIQRQSLVLCVLLQNVHLICFILQKTK